MAYVDEQIALLEREYRRIKAEEAAGQAEEEGRKGTEETESLTLQELLEEVRTGEGKLPGYGHYTFETRRYFEEAVPMVILKDFYTGVQETENAAVFVNHDDKVSQILTLADEDMRKLSIRQMEERLTEGMQAAGAYAEVVKREEQKGIRYLVYRTPGKEGWTYNLLFSMKQGSGRCVGNFNCMEKDKETFGLLLEALALRAGELADGTQEA